MPEKLQEKKSAEKENGKTGDGKPETEDEAAWSSDQEKRSYYYDDGCGYEIYDPEEDDQDTE